MERILHYAHKRTAGRDKHHRHYIVYSEAQETEEILRDPEMMIGLKGRRKILNQGD